MQSDTFMLYKLMILYILSRVNFPLTNAQLTNIQTILIFNVLFRN